MMRNLFPVYVSWYKFSRFTIFTFLLSFFYCIIGMAASLCSLHKCNLNFCSNFFFFRRIFVPLGEGKGFFNAVNISVVV
jgi:hypothetical protein